MPDLKVSHEPDFRDRIAYGWPNSVDDSESKKDWDWEYNISIEEMVRRAIAKIDDSHKKNSKVKINL